MIHDYLSSVLIHKANQPQHQDKGTCLSCYNFLRCSQSTATRQTGALINMLVEKQTKEKNKQTSKINKRSNRLCIANMVTFPRDRFGSSFIKTAYGVMVKIIQRNKERQWLGMNSFWGYSSDRGVHTGATLESRNNTISPPLGNEIYFHVKMFRCFCHPTQTPTSVETT